MKTYMAFGKKEMISMTMNEFIEWMKDKTMYTTDTYLSWCNKYTKSHECFRDYVPYKHFILPATVKVRQYNLRFPKYGPDVLDLYIDDGTQYGKGYWTTLHWTATVNEKTKNVRVHVHNKPQN